MNKVHGTVWNPRDDVWVKEICDSATYDVITQMYKKRRLTELNQRVDQSAEGQDTNEQRKYMLY